MSDATGYKDCNCFTFTSDELPLVVRGLSELYLEFLREGYESFEAGRDEQSHGAIEFAARVMKIRQKLVRK